MEKFNKLANKTVVVFGGSSGVGFAVAQGALASKAAVVIVSSSAAKVKAKVDQLKDEFPDKNVRGYTCDLKDLDNIESNLIAVFDKIGKVDHVVYTAGDAHDRLRIQDMTIKHAFEAGNVRFFAPIMLAKVFPKYLTNMSADCSFILTNAQAAERPTAGWPVEIAYTGAIRHLAGALSIDLAPVRVNVVGLGMTDTEIFDGMMNAEQKAQFFEESARGHLTGRIGLPEDVAELYLALMKDRGSTGTSVMSDCGWKNFATLTAHGA